MQMYTKVKTQLHEPAKGGMYIPVCVYNIP